MVVNVFDTSVEVHAGMRVIERCGTSYTIEKICPPCEYPYGVCVEHLERYGNEMWAVCIRDRDTLFFYENGCKTNFTFTHNFCLYCLCESIVFDTVQLTRC